MLTNLPVSSYSRTSAGVEPAIGFSYRKKPKVLLVEDDPVLSKVLSFAFENRGVSVTVANDGKKAFEMMEHLDEPSLVLLDLMLPFYDGYEILQKIREESGWKDVPIIVMTSNGRQKYATRAFNSGANDYLVKPIRFEDLMVKLRSFTEFY